jgi:hypothetical protein
MATWKEDIIQALKNLGGKAHRFELHKEVAKIRNGKLNNTWTQTIQRELETFSSDSDAYSGKEDIFYMVEGKGEGVWGLRKLERNINLLDILKKISSGWIEYRKFCQSTSKTGASIKIKKSNHEIARLVEKDWPNSISKNVNLKKYAIDSSVGKGNLVPGPWLTIMDKSITETAQEMYYIAYLFSRSAKKLYLSIAIAGTQFQHIYGISNEAVEKIEIFKNQFQQLFKYLKPKNITENIDLLEDNLNFEEPISGSSRNLLLLFEKGSFFSKEYDLTNLSKEELEYDLKNYIEIYDKIVSDPKSENFNIAAESLLTNQRKNTSQIDFDYEIPDFEPKEKKLTSGNKNLKSTAEQARTKRKTQDSKLIGKTGENYVVQYEKEKLKKLGLNDLAEKVYNHDDHREYPGWDITSFDKNGKKIFIEVKSAAKKKNIFNITSKEWDAAQIEKNNYFIYLVEDTLNNKIKIVAKIQNPAYHAKNNQIEVRVSEYEIRLAR